MGGYSTLRQALRHITQLLTEAGIENAQHEAGILLCSIVRCSLLTIYTQPELTLSEEDSNQLDQLVRDRIVNRVPLQYLVGWVEFCRLPLRITPVAFIPRPETEFFVERLIASIRTCKWLPRRILDIGTGSGCIALALASAFPDSEVIGWDRDDAALCLAESNAQSLGLRNVSFEQVDVMKFSQECAPFSLIVSNPPYIPLADVAALPREVLHEPLGALTDGADGLTFYRFLREHLTSLLDDGGVVALECNDWQARVVAGLFENFHTHVASDQFGVERFVIVVSDPSHPVLRKFSLEEQPMAS
jgi:release factor glutamine methyltransferase